MRDNARQLVFIKHSAHARSVICAAMHREKFEVQGYVKDNSIKQCKKKVINTYTRVPPIITRVNKGKHVIFFNFFFPKSQLEGSLYSFSVTVIKYSMSAMVGHFYMSLY